MLFEIQQAAPGRKIDVGQRTVLIRKQEMKWRLKQHHRLSLLRRKKGTTKKKVQEGRRKKKKSNDYAQKKVIP